jgi:hypothetical protein
MFWTGRGPEHKLFIDATARLGGGGIDEQLDRARSVKGVFRGGPRGEHRKAGGEEGAA